METPPQRSTREANPQNDLIGLPAIIGFMLVLLAVALVWRAFVPPFPPRLRFSLVVIVGLSAFLLFVKQEAVARFLDDWWWKYFCKKVYATLGLDYGTIAHVVSHCNKTGRTTSFREVVAALVSPGGEHQEKGSFAADVVVMYNEVRSFLVGVKSSTRRKK